MLLEKRSKQAFIFGILSIVFSLFSPFPLDILDDHFEMVADLIYSFDNFLLLIYVFPFLGMISALIGINIGNKLANKKAVTISRIGLILNIFALVGEAYIFVWGLGMY